MALLQASGSCSAVGAEAFLTFVCCWRFSQALATSASTRRSDTPLFVARWVSVELFKIPSNLVLDCQCTSGPKHQVAVGVFLSCPQKWRDSRLQRSSESRSGAAPQEGLTDHEQRVAVEHSHLQPGMCRDGQRSRQVLCACGLVGGRWTTNTEYQKCTLLYQLGNPKESNIVAHRLGAWAGKRERIAAHNTLHLPSS